ncbi:MAG: DUF2269 domain-containing protein [Actinomycetota bacterium]|nr:DUF2269 domain-containing protein [Actinomycetota bacterium]
MEIPAAVTTYDISLWIHISAVVAGLGITFAEAVMFPLAMKTDPRNLPFVFRMQIIINRYFANPALALIIITGIYQVIEYDWGFEKFWISATFLIVFILGGLTGGYFIPTDKKLEAMVTEEIKAAGDGPVELSDEFLAKSRVEGMVGALTGVLIIIAIFLMVAKPGA